MDNSSLPVVVAICGDPGGANAVAPVIEALRREGRVNVHALAYQQARMQWLKRNLTCEEIPEDMTCIAAAKRLRLSKALLLLTGTSVNPVELEKQFIAAAHETGIPSLAVLDFWSNYRRRFSDVEDHLVYLPDRIAVMDERARDEMIAVGFEPIRLIITGQPALDDLAKLKTQFNSKRRHAIIDALSVAPDELFVLFVSQPMSILNGADAINPHYYGYTEKTVLSSLTAALDQIAEEHNQKIALVIRPHPRESDEFLDKLDYHTIRMLVYTEGKAYDLAMAADLVIGMNTILLMEACYLGCITVSIQPGLRLPDPLPTNLWGISRAVYNEGEIKPVVEQMLLDDQVRASAQARLSYLRPDNDATRRVTDLVYQMLGLDSGN